MRCEESKSPDARAILLLNWKPDTPARVKVRHAARSISPLMLVPPVNSSGELHTEALFFLLDFFF